MGSISIGRYLYIGILFLYKSCIPEAPFIYRVRRLIYRVRFIYIGSVLYRKRFRPPITSRKQDRRAKTGKKRCAPSLNGQIADIKHLESEPDHPRFEPICCKKTHEL